MVGWYMSVVLALGMSRQKDPAWANSQDPVQKLRNNKKLESSSGFDRKGFGQCHTGRGVS